MRLHTDIIEKVVKIKTAHTDKTLACTEHHNKQRSQNSQLSSLLKTKFDSTQYRDPLSLSQ